MTARMKIMRMTVGAAAFLVIGESAAALRTYRESTGVVSNPGQGWTVIAADSCYARYANDLAIGAVYNRYDWADMEPEEGRYDWAKIEHDLEFARRHGIPALFRIMCANSGAASPVTPDWVWDRGAKRHQWESIAYSGTIVTNRSPVFEDATFQRLHRRFLAAFAAKYDGDPRLCGLDLGSYGNWGEWHCGKLPPAVPTELEPEFRERSREVCRTGKGGKELYLAVHDSRRERARATGKWLKAERLDREGMKPYVDMYLDNFKKTDIVFMSDGAEVLDYAIGDGPTSRVGLRRDGIGLEGHFKRWIGSPAYAHVTRMADVWRDKPIWFEGTRDSQTLIAWGKGLFEYGFAFMLGNHVSLVNCFPFSPEQVRNDPKYRPLVDAINLQAGARLVPLSSSLDVKKDELTLALYGINRGVAKIYLDYVATLEVRASFGKVLHAADLATDVRQWLPGPFAIYEKIRLPVAMPADARVVLRLRHRANVLRDFRFATSDLTPDGAIPLDL